MSACLIKFQLLEAASKDTDRVRRCTSVATNVLYATSSLVGGILYTGELKAES